MSHNRKKLIIPETELSGWVSLIHESQALKSTFISEELESYLVFLLMRFTKRSDFIQRALGVDILQIQEDRVEGQVRYERLKDIGDICLMFAGLFPEISRKRNVNESYYIDLGRVSFEMLSSSKFHINTSVFEKLSSEFEPAINILSGIRDINKYSSNRLLNISLEQECANDSLILSDDYKTRKPN